MKKLISMMLAFVIAASTFCTAAMAIGQQEPAETVRSCIDIEVGTVKNVLFTLNAENHGEIELKDENGKTVSHFNDMGVGGDKRINDGIYSSKLTLGSNKRGISRYTAYADGKAIREYEVNFYREYTQSDYAKLDVINSSVNDYEEQLKSRELSDDAMIREMKTYISELDGIESVVEENGSLTYVTDAGIPCVYASFSENTRGPGAPSTDHAVMYNANGDEISMESVQSRGNEELQSWTNPNVLLVRPFRHVQGEEGFHNENYVNAANNIIKYSGGYITILDDDDTSPAKLRDNFYKNGFILVDSHGLTSGNCSYMVVWDGDGYGAADLNAGRVLKTNTPNHVLVTGSYFKYNYELENRRMENTFLYFGICFGMLFDGLRQPLFDLGAVCAYGYDNSVTMGYEAANLKIMYPYMAKLCAEDETRTYNLEEAAAEAIAKNGSIDPYSDLGTKLIMDGDTHFVFYKPDVALVNMEFEIDSIPDAVQKTNCYIPVKVTPEKMAYGYTQEWISSDPEVVEIAGPRVGYCKNPGTAVITAKFTYGDKVYEDSATVTVAEVKPERIEVSISAVNARFKVGQTRELYTTVIPSDSSEKGITFKSNNTGVVTVTNTGTLTAVRPGKAIINVSMTAYPEVNTDFTVEVVTDIVYRCGSDADTVHDFVIATRESSPNMLMCTPSATEGFVQHRSISKYNGYFTGNITANALWKFIKAEPAGYYIYNADQNLYLTRGEGGAALLTEAPQTAFAFDGTHITVANPGDDTVNTFLKIRSKAGGFCFAEESGSSTKVDLGCVVDFKNTDEYKTVTFEADGTAVATQVVAAHDKAVAASALRLDGKTFIGWDACLYDITSDITAKALFEDGVSDKHIVTFKDYDGTLIARVEAEQGGEITAPSAPMHDGKTFVGWSEDYAKSSDNMIVFAIYENGLKGDSNEDGSVNTADAVYVLKYAAGMIMLTDTQLANSDVNADGNVNTADASQILKFAAGMIAEF